MVHVTVRVYGPLNDFLPPHRRHLAWLHALDRHATIKDVIERLGVPHPEIDLILVDGRSVPFDYVIDAQARIAVYPRFTAIDIAPLTRVRPPALEEVRFVADVHLGKLARHLRLVGVDTAYSTDAADAVLASLAERERRILLTRDHALLKRRNVHHGYFVRTTEGHRQLAEVLGRFGPLELTPFSRCLRCNGALLDVPKAAIDAALLPRTRQHYDRFKQCAGCARVYWKGAHWARLTRAVEAATRNAGCSIRTGPA